MIYLKKFTAYSTFFLSSLFIGLLLCEVLVRFAAPQRLAFAVGMYEADPELVFKLRPGLDFRHAQYEFDVPVVTNSMGFRDEEVGPKPENTYRILGVGDSFSFANGVKLEETYFKRLEQCLSAGRGPQVEIINGAVPAYSLVQEKRFVKRYSEQLDVDAVLVGFYVGNDFTDSMELFDENGHALIEVRDHSLHSLKERDLEEHPLRIQTASLRTFLAFNSHLYTFLISRTSELLARAGLRSPVPPPEFLEKEFSPHMNEAWEVTRELFMDLAEYTRSHGLDLYIVALPAMYQTHQEMWRDYLDIQGLDPDRFELDKAQKLLDEFSRVEELEFVDVLPGLQNAGREELLYFPVDSHMNPAGHRVVADILCNRLGPDGLLTGAASEGR